MKTRQQLAEEIDDLCREHGCSEKIAKIHAAQYVDRNWHPHPSAEFETWWKTQMEYTQGEDSQRAYNCQEFRDRFLEQKTSVPN